MPAKQPEHSRRQRGYICSRAPCKQVTHLPSSGFCGQSRHSFPTPWATPRSPLWAAERCLLADRQLWSWTPCPPPHGQGWSKSHRAQMSSPVAHSGIAPGWREHPKCSADTTKELLGAALAQLQLARADPASLRAPTLPIRFICSPQPLCRAAPRCSTAAASH